MEDERPNYQRRWSNNGPKNGLYYEIVSSHGEYIPCASNLESVEAIVSTLNLLELKTEVLVNSNLRMQTRLKELESVS